MLQFVQANNKENIKALDFWPFGSQMYQQEIDL